MPQPLNLTEHDRRFLRAAKIHIDLGAAALPEAEREIAELRRAMRTRAMADQVAAMREEVAWQRGESELVRKDRDAWRRAAWVAVGVLVAVVVMGWWR